ncbi:hypothetical protein LC55x_4589 [Lysobacter capsici]|uniref:hypothetical protein n=1 Tax=Lysobacter capsici TaxID=435897 RepID=UPI0007165486|nr:hypothetical protein [Lysobacter capsici]ALN87837.1 hypothetical protein LC55x_4589 [Lysobacter capsici]
MSQRFDHELSDPLAQRVRETDTVPADAVERAQQRLTQRLRSQPRPRRMQAPRWIAASALAALLVVVVMSLPMLSGGGDAFAAVQDHLRHFVHLEMNVTQRVQGRVIQTSRTLVDAHGVLRTDVGDQLSIVVDPQRGRLLTLLHASRQAMLTALPKGKATQHDTLQWLDELRNFKGKATPLADTRMIDGQRAHGWSLRLHGVDMDIWADPSGLPLAMRQNNGAGLEIDYRFTVDGPVAPGRLSSDPPPGYALVPADTD